MAVANPVALYDALNNLGFAVLLSEGDQDAERARTAADTFAEASLSAADAFPEGSREAEALNLIVGAVGDFMAEQVLA